MTEEQVKTIAKWGRDCGSKRSSEFGAAVAQMARDVMELQAAAVSDGSSRLAALEQWRKECEDQLQELAERLKLAETNIDSLAKTADEHWKVLDEALRCEALTCGRCGQPVGDHREEPEHPEGCDQCGRPPVGSESCDDDCHQPVTTYGGGWSADICRANGWKVGTHLAGDEGSGETIIVITAIGEQCIYAREVAHDGHAVKAPEYSWYLSAREWREVEPPIPERGSDGQPSRLGLCPQCGTLLWEGICTQGCQEPPPSIIQKDLSSLGVQNKRLRAENEKLRQDVEILTNERRAAWKEIAALRDALKEVSGASNAGSE